MLLINHNLQGLVSLPYKPLKVLFTGDHFAISHSSELTIFEQYNKQSGIASACNLCGTSLSVYLHSDQQTFFELAVRMQLNRVRKFLDLDFEWILPREYSPHFC